MRLRARALLKGEVATPFCCRVHRTCALPQPPLAEYAISPAETLKIDRQTVKNGSMVETRYVCHNDGCNQKAIRCKSRKMENEMIILSSRMGYRAFKRAFDIVFSAGVIIVCAIPGAALSAVIVKDTGGSPIYAQERVGMHGRKFRLLKFRTMVADADDLEKHLTAEQLEEWHREHKLQNDPRVTPLGRVLRKTSIDEIPQFFNVLLGQMSIVGPRAITEEELVWYGDDKDVVLSVPVGITGLWQTGPRNACTFISGQRQQIELEYVRSASIILDARIFFRTFKTMLDGTGR